MANKRMFSKDIVRTDMFLDMPHSSQNLYFHLNLDADVKGFVSPKIVMRIINASDDDLKILIAKGYVIPFESGVIIVTHWNVNNQIRITHEAPSQFEQEYKKIVLSPENSYKLLSNYRSNPVVLPPRIGKFRHTARTHVGGSNRLKNKPVDNSHLNHISNSNNRKKTENPGYNKFKGMQNKIKNIADSKKL